MSADFSDIDISGHVSRVDRVQLTDEHHVFVRVLPGSEVGRLVEAEKMSDTQRRVAYYAALFLCSEDGAPRHPEVSSADVDKMLRWPGGYLARITGHAMALNGMVPPEGN